PAVPVSIRRAPAGHLERDAEPLYVAALYGEPVPEVEDRRRRRLRIASEEHLVECQRVIGQRARHSKLFERGERTHCPGGATRWMATRIRPQRHFVCRPEPG